MWGWSFQILTNQKEELRSLTTLHKNCTMILQNYISLANEIPQNINIYLLELQVNVSWFTVFCCYLHDSPLTRLMQTLSWRLRASTIKQLRASGHWPWRTSSSSAVMLSSFVTATLKQCARTNLECPVSPSETHSEVSRCQPNQL